MITVLVVDDEPLARESVKIHLREHADFVVVGECSNGRQALEQIKQKQPDLVFLDIQMPVMTGLELAKTLALKQHIIFTTAYHHFAVDAFEVGAVDYLLKPYQAKRFSEALQKVKTLLALKAPSRESMITDSSEQTNAQVSYIDRVIVKDPGRIRIVNIADINWIAGAGNYVEIHVYNSERCYLHRETMSSIEAQLDPNDFIRIHRSSIVRKRDIVELRSNEQGDYTVVLKTGEELTLSRRHRHKLDDLL